MKRLTKKQMIIFSVGQLGWSMLSGINVAWISVFIVLFYLFMTMYCTPYNALISEFGKTQEGV